MNRNRYITNTGSQPNKIIGSDSDGMEGGYNNTDYVDTESLSQSKPYDRNYPIEKIPDNLIEEEDEKEETDEENSDSEISMLFQDAIVKLEKIKAYANQQKKQIVVDLAKDLEDKIETDTICMEIVIQLRGQVSAGFVRECLDEKYKQKHRAENARKQKKRQDYLEEKEDIDKLAQVTTLNQELEKDKIILVGAHGQSLVQGEGENNDKHFSDINDDSSEGNTESSSSNLPYQKGHEQLLGPKNEPVDLKECPSCRGLYYENIELKEVIEKQNHFTPADKMKNTNDPNDEVKTANKILDFEFCKPYREVSEYVGSFLEFGDSTEVWFSGIIDTITGKVISSGYGRIRQQQEQGRLTSKNIDEDDWEVVE